MHLSARFSVAALIVAALVLGDSYPGSSQQTPYEVDAVLSLTGSAAFLGTKEQEALHILEGVINKSGGIDGHPVKFSIQDDASNPQTAVQLATGLISKGARAIIGSSVLATCSAIAPLIDKTGPVTYCLSPLAKPAAGSYWYSTSVAGTDYAAVVPRLLHAHGWTRVAMLNSIDATGQDMERDFGASIKADGRGLTIVANEHFTPGDISVTAQLARIKEQKPQVLLAFATGPAFATVMRNMRDSGLDIPVVGSGGNMNYAQLERYSSFLPKTLFFLAGGGVVADPTVSLKQKDAQATYLQAYSAAGLRPEYASTLIWDPAMLVIDALRHAGPKPTNQKVNDYIQGVRGWAGIAGVYDFRTYPQRGLGGASTVVYRWDSDKKALLVVPLAR